jgi:hypothetical protein
MPQILKERFMSVVALKEEIKLSRQLMKSVVLKWMEMLRFILIKLYL